MPATPSFRPFFVLMTLLLLGGVPAFSVLVDEPVVPAEAVSAEAGALAATSAMQTARAVHTATLLHDGTVLITGGFAKDRESDPFASAELYDPKRDVFVQTGSLQTARQSHSATLLDDGRVLIAGGYDGSYLASAELYDPASGTFTATGIMNAGRIGHRATRLADGRVLITGGAGAGMTLRASAEVYDPATGQFAAVGAMTVPRIGHTQTLLHDGTVLITGGTVGQQRAKHVSATAELFDPATGTFREAGMMTIPRHKHAAVLMEDERVLIVGGSDERDGRGRYDSAEIFDPATGSFAATGSLRAPRFKLRTAVTLLTDGTVLIAGGAKSVELYHPEKARFTTIPGGFGSPWFFSTVTLLQDGRALITGGYDQQIESTAKAWLYTP